MKTLYCLFFMLGLYAADTSAQTVPVALNLPATLTADIRAGATTAELTFTVGGADHLRFDLIAPLDGATVTLLDPTGAVVMPAGDPRVSFHPGSAQTPPLPGGVFTTEQLTLPANGAWRLRLEFPAAPGNTVVLATIIAHSRWQAGIATDRSTVLVGEDAAIGMAVLDEGKPVTGLTPQIAVNTAVGSTARDNGQGPDGLAGDGIYSIDHVFGAPGLYTVTGTATIPTPDGPITRSATMQIKAVPPSLQLGTVSLQTEQGPGGCTTALQVQPQFNVLAAGRYATLVRLSAPNGRYLDWRQAGNQAAGTVTLQAAFTAENIRRTLASDGPYTISRIDTLRAVDGELTLAFRLLDAGRFDLDLAALCQPNITLAPGLVATPVLRDGYIDALELAFSMQVASAGFYQISLKLLGADGQDVGLINASRALNAGGNQVTVTVPAAQFQRADGPYRAISLLVLGGGDTARLAELGTTSAWSRWQFYPARAGDLDNDGAIGAGDQAILTQYRGQPALQPGDRRDLDRNGVIDLRDARLLQQQR